MLAEHGIKIAPSTYCEHAQRTPSGRDRRDEMLKAQIVIWSPAGSRRWHRTGCGCVTSPNVSTWSGWVYVAFVTDAYARRILGWRCGTTMTTQLVLDALEQAIWTRQRTGDDLESVVAHSDKGSQNTALKYAE